MKLTLKLKDMEEVKRFVDITSQYSEDMALVHGRYVVDAKSILGVLSLDLTRVLTVQYSGENQEFEAYLETLSPDQAAVVA